MDKKYNYFTLRLKFKNPPHHNADIALVFHSARLELKRVIFSNTFFVHRKGSHYQTVVQME